MSLKAKLARRIAAAGPLTVAEFMTACLHDPAFGYYATRPALGAEGDFITAPLVSQMFGELIGLWAAQVWTHLGAPDRVQLVEMGPGDGTLMSDALRAARLAPGFLRAADLWLVETSAPLMARQQAALAGSGARWAAALEDVAATAPIILVANELLDCLPARQLVRTDAGWAEIVIGATANDGLTFGLTSSGEALVPPALRDAPVGAVVEISPAQENLGRLVGARIARCGGAALFTDYGRDRPGTGNTLQALRRHQKVDPLQTAGEADLTVHADFPAFAAAAVSMGAEATTIRTQGDFLKSLGIEARRDALIRARPDRADAIQRQFQRLTATDQMGVLFKAVAIHSPGLEVAGF